ncbi:GNAT family N-acetyltransferase [Bosea sp. BK604]|uniref:GNAT family N-acetyltransferase n=1 Tax=Bosea sp. BK604 TaxID=2512180 RepID=UPI001050ECC7|nr:GNAT family N-acetyltransferase [Bosea sp. BK604]TCR64540.1 RimJ/RimL family protein N-acetyltransferase [Bosea sp. BK604]
MIETSRLLLRPHALEDFEPWYAMFSDRELFRFIAAPQMSREDAWNRLLRYAGHWSLLGYGMFAVFDKATGQFIGDVGHADFHRELGAGFDGYPEASWIMAKPAHGRGLAAEAVSACHDWIAGRHAPARTVCMINPENAASLRLAGKLGYQLFDSRTYKGNPCLMLERVAP